jgi:hypothetical protein
MSVNNKLYRRERCAAPASIAILIGLALLLTPLCATVCTASTGCESDAAVAGSSENCHHQAIFNHSDSEWPALVSADPALCHQHELPALISSEQESSSLVNNQPSALLFSQFQQTHYLNFNFHLRTSAWHLDVDSSPTSLPATTTSVLRI